MTHAGSSMTLAATTGPNMQPRPTSSTPAINRKPRDRRSDSHESSHFQACFLGMKRQSAELRTLFETSSLTLETAQVIEFGSANFAGADQVDVVDGAAM